MEENTAERYLAYLAAAICGAREDTLRVTDSNRSIAVLGPPDREETVRLRELRYTAGDRYAVRSVAGGFHRELVSFSPTSHRLHDLLANTARIP